MSMGILWLITIVTTLGLLRLNIKGVGKSSRDNYLMSFWLQFDIESVLSARINDYYSDHHSLYFLGITEAVKSLWRKKVKKVQKKEEKKVQKKDEKKAEKKDEKKEEKKVEKKDDKKSHK